MISECLTAPDLTRPSRNQKGILPQKSPQPPFVKGGPGGISEICCQFAHNVISKRLILESGVLS